ncbi:MAG: anti-sigma-K factor RskA [Candidatus Roseilinea sp.]|nr:MAG: anti-sigma-K factor RskA [Candidatus Roseilinea sp.]
MSDMSENSTRANADPVEDLIALYALNALDADDRAAVERRLAADARARALLDEMRAAVDRLNASAGEVEPPAHIKRRLMARVDADLASQGMPARRESAWERLKQALFPITAALAAAAILIAIGLGVWATSLQGQLAQAQQELALLQSPGLRVVSLPVAENAPAAAQIILVAAPTEATGLLTVSGLKPLTPNQTYQFWLLRSGQPVPAGTFSVDANGAGKLIVRAADRIGAFDQAGVTIEPAGGSETPTLSALVAIGSIQ